MNFNTTSNAQNLINNLKRNGGGCEPVTISDNTTTASVGFVVYTSEEDKRNAEKFFSELIANSRNIDEAKAKIFDLIRSNDPNCNCTNEKCDNDGDMFKMLENSIEQFIQSLLQD